MSTASSSSTSSISSTQSTDTTTVDKKKRKEQLNAIKEIFQAEPEIQWRELTLIRKLNDSKSGEVWYGRCRDTDVAVRKVKWDNDPAKVEELKREVTILRKIMSPNISMFLGAGIHHHTLMIYSEYAKDSLRTYINTQPGLKPIDRLNLIYEAALGMFWLHSVRLSPTDPNAIGIVHKHVKTSCFLVFDHERVKVCDFSLSTFWIGEDAYTSVWAAPEIRAKKSTFTLASDVYSFGLVMLEVLSGIRPMTLDDVNYDVMMSKCVDPETKAFVESDFKDFRDIVVRCISPDPRSRPKLSQIVNVIEKTISSKLIPNADSAKWWNETFSSKEDVFWSDFIARYSKLFRRDNERAVICLRVLLCDQATTTVTRTRFGDLVGRLCNSKNDWKNLCAIAEKYVDEVWFHGYLSVNAATAIVANSKPGSFLVRFSSSFGGFTISYLDMAGAIKHVRVTHSPGKYIYANNAYKSLSKLIEKNKEIFVYPLFSQSLRSIVNGIRTVPEGYLA